MLALNDLESIKKLATVLVIPFFAAAYIADGASQTVTDPVLDWFRNHDSSAIRGTGWFLWLFVVVMLVTMTVAAVDWVIQWLDLRLEGVFIAFAVAISCLTAGVFVLNVFIPEVPKSPLNPLWHIGMLCYGFNLLNRSEK